MRDLLNAAIDVATVGALILIIDKDGGSGDGLLVCDCDAYDEYLISISLIPPVSCLVRSALDLFGQSDDTLRLAKWNVHFTAKISNMTKEDKTCKSIVLLQPCSPITVTGPPWAEEWSTYLEDFDLSFEFISNWAGTCLILSSKKLKLWWSCWPWGLDGSPPMALQGHWEGPGSALQDLTAVLVPEQMSSVSVCLFNKHTANGWSMKTNQYKAVRWHFRQPLFKADVF